MNEAEPGGDQRGARFILQNVCDQPAVPHGGAGAPGGPVKLRTGVARSIGAKSGNFRGETVVQLARDRPADSDHADQAIDVLERDTKLPSYRWGMVPMKLSDEAERLVSRDRIKGHARLPRAKPINTSRNAGGVAIAAFFVSDFNPESPWFRQNEICAAAARGVLQSRGGGFDRYPET